MQIFENVIKRPDGSYVINHNGYPYHVPHDLEEFAEMFAEVDAYAKVNPNQVKLSHEIPIKYYSPNGDANYYEYRPDNCYTEEEWFGLHPELKPAGPSIEEILAEYDNRIDDRLESFAKQLYSKGLANAVTYTTSSNPIWRMEAEYLSAVRDQTWEIFQSFLDAELPKVLAGEREMPSWEEIEVILPVLSWPKGSRGFK